MTTQTLLDYINQQLQRGIDEKELTQQLSELGWRKRDIDEALHKARALESSEPPLSSRDPASVPIFAKIIAVLFYLISVPMVVAFITLLTVRFSTLIFLPAVPVGFGVHTGVIIGLSILVWAGLNFSAGRGLWTGKYWGRTLAVVISSLNVSYVLFSTFSYIVMAVIIAVNGFIISYLLFSPDVRSSFHVNGPRTKEIVSALLVLVVYTLIIISFN